MLLPFSGTEMRQSTMYDPTGTTPNALKESLEDPGRRRWHLIDGDIEQINISACFVLPPIDGTTGKVIPSECGGRRRVDYVLTRKEDKVVSLLLQVLFQHNEACTKLLPFFRHIQMHFVEWKSLYAYSVFTKVCS